MLMHNFTESEIYANLNYLSLHISGLDDVQYALDGIVAVDWIDAKIQSWKRCKMNTEALYCTLALVLNSIIIGYCKGEIPIDCNKLDSITKDSEKRNGKSFGVFLATISMVLAHAEMKTNSAQRICTSISVNTEHLNGINTFDAKSKEQCIEITTWHELHTEWTHSALTIGIECIVYCKYIDGDMSKLLDSVHSKYPNWQEVIFNDHHNYIEWLLAINRDAFFRKL